MIDKKVITCDFRGIKPGHLVRFDDGRVGLVMERFISSASLDEGHAEIFYPTLNVMLGSMRKYVHVDDVEAVEGES
jgi:hypothetical protein